MKRSVAKAAFILLFAGFWLLPAGAAITVQLDSLGAFQYQCPKAAFQGVEKFTEVNTLDIQHFPRLRVRLKAFREGYEIPIKQDQVLIVQENIVYVPERFERMPDGWYEIEWKTRDMGERVVKLDNDCDPPRYLYVRAELVVVDGEDVGYQTAYYRSTNIAHPVLRFLRGYTPIKEFFVGNGKPGDTVRTRVYFQAQSGFYDPATNAEFPIRIDSMRITSPYFRARWRGNFLAPGDTIFPVLAYPVFRYPIDLEFFPPSAEPQQAELWIYAEQGLYAVLPLFGNRPQVTAEPRLQLQQPAGGEIYTPCMEYPIRWDGANPQLPVFVEYRLSDTARWQLIQKVNDTNRITWKVPDIITDSLLIRIRQPAMEAEAEYLPADTAGILQIQFDRTGAHFLTAYDNGCVGVWTTDMWQQFLCLRLRDYDSAIDSVRFRRKLEVDTGVVEYEVVEYYQPEKVQVIAASFVPMGVAVIFRSQFRWPDTNAQRLVTKHSLHDTLAFFDLQSPYPVHQVQLPYRVHIQQMVYNATAQELICAPSNLAALLIYDSIGTFRRKVVVGAPIEDLALNERQKELYVLLLGSVQIRSLEDYRLLAEVPLHGAPRMRHIGADPIGRFFAVAEYPTPVGLLHSPSMAIHLWDRQKLRLIKIQRRQWSEVQRLSFSSTGRFLVAGIPGIPQIVVWDLVTDQLYTNYTGHPTRLTDVQFHPSAPIMLSSAEGQWKNLRKRVFSYPEEDVVEQYLRIVPPKLATDTLVPPVDELYLGDTVQWEEPAAICNVGEAPIPLQQQWTRFQKFVMLSPAVPDTLQPGACRTVVLRYIARDTGAVADTLFLATCSRQFVLPFVASVRDRSMAIDSQRTVLGSACVGERTVRIVPLVANLDPKPLKINGLQLYNPYQAPIELVSTVKDTTLLPGDTLFVAFAFTPAKPKEYQVTVFVYYADQGKFKKKVRIRGRGILPAAQFAVSTVPFIPEIASQAVPIINASEEEIRFTEATIDPPVYTLGTPLPLVIAPGDTALVELKATPGGTATLTLRGEPCDLSASLQLIPYQARSTIRIPTITIDPRDTVEIPIQYEMTENAPYINERFFEATLWMPADRFLPLSVRSPGRTVEILEHTVIDTVRRLAFRIWGHFDSAGTLFFLRGIPGLGLQDHVPIRWAPTSIFWGTAVDTRAYDGMLVFRYPDPHRRVYRLPFSVTAVYPQPASDQIAVVVATPEFQTVRCELRNTAGQLLRRWTATFQPPETILHLSFDQLPAGTYWLRIVSVRGGVVIPLVYQP